VDSVLDLTQERDRLLSEVEKLGGEKELLRTTLEKTVTALKKAQEEIEVRLVVWLLFDFCWQLLIPLSSLCCHCGLNSVLVHQIFFSLLLAMFVLFQSRPREGNYEILIQK
jgi:heme A synthase